MFEVRRHGIEMHLQMVCNSYIGYTFCRKSKLSTHHLCIIGIPEVFTDGPPSLIYTYLHLPLQEIRTTNQTNITIPTRSCKKECIYNKIRVFCIV